MRCDIIAALIGAYIIITRNAAYIIVRRRLLRVARCAIALMSITDMSRVKIILISCLVRSVIKDLC